MRHPLLLCTVLALSSFGLGFALSAPAEPRQDDSVADESESERHERLVRELLVVTKARESQEAALQLQMEAFDKIPFLPDGFAEEFEARFDHDWIVEETVVLFVDKLKPTTLEAALEFFRSDEGGVFVDAQAEITLELMRIGQAYGEKLGQEVAEDLSR